MSNTSARRRWFQLHLSTALALVFTLGLLMRGNLLFQNDNHDNTQVYGWPMPAYICTVADFCGGLEDTCVWIRYEPIGTGTRLSFFYYPGVLADAAAATTICLTVCIAFEWLIRRRVDRAP